MVTDVKIYMRDRTKGAGYNEGAVRTKLEDMFRQVCKQRDSTAKYAYVFWLQEKYCPLPRPNDVIVYILPSSIPSKIKSVYGVDPGSGSGATYIGRSGAISEVYLNHEINQTNMGLTHMIYHELLHNKRKQGDSLHVECYAGTTAIASAFHTGSGMLQTKFSECDKRLMAPFLDKPVPQYCY
jgi:hypothetical protein